jgi:hypothetical protein
MTEDKNTLSNSARELIERLGDSALIYAHDRIDTLRAKGSPREIDQALLLLGEIEDLLEKENP